MIACIMTVVAAAAVACDAAVVRCVSTATCGIINIFINATVCDTSTNTTGGHIHLQVMLAVIVVVIIIADTDIATAGCGFDLRSVNVERIKYQHMVIVLGQSDHITFGGYL